MMMLLLFHFALYPYFVVLHRPEDKKHLVWKLLPHRAARTLRTTLEALCEKIHKFEKMRLNHIRARRAQPDASIDSEFTIKRREVSF